MTANPTKTQGEMSDGKENHHDHLYCDSVTEETTSQLVKGNETVRIRIPFCDFAGKAVYHCHILGHEDLGMMGIVEMKG